MLKLCATMRATISLPPPGASGTITRTGLVGSEADGDAACAAKLKQPSTARHARRSKVVSMVEALGIVMYEVMRCEPKQRYALDVSVL